MYHEHFGLERAPFRITPDTELFYAGGGRGEVLEALVYAVTSGEGIVKVTGEVGTGKTMLCRMLEVRLPSSVEVVYIANPSLSPEDILHAIALEMNLPLDGTTNRLTVMHSLQQRLLEMHAQNRRVVVFVEEAQGMPMETLEEIRLLSNLETQRDKLLQIVLFGQPELDEALDRSSIRQLRERITHSFRLEPLSRDDVREYVRFRMRAVGYRGPDVFTEGAYRQLSRASQGLVRRINILADKALLAAFADDTHTVSGRHMSIAVEDGSFGGRSNRRAWWLAGVAALLAAVLGTLIVFDSLPWQRWLQRYGIGQTALVSTPPGPPPAPVRPGPAAQAAVASAPMVAQAPAEAGGVDTPTTVAATPIVVDPAAPRASTLPAAPMSGAVVGAQPAAPVVGATTPTAIGPTLAMEATSSSAATDTPVSAPPAATAEPQAVSAATSVVDALPTTAASAPPVRTESPPQVVAAVAAATAPVAATAASATAAVVASARATSPPAPAATAAATATAPAAPAESMPAATSVDSDNRLLAQRVAATTQWLQSARGSNLCIQLLLADVGRQDNLEAFLERMQRLGVLDRIYVYETVIGARSWFGVLYGDFESFDGAREALQALPEELRRHKPFIRNVRDIVGQI